MTDDEKQHDMKKKAIFDAMSKKGQERILRMGYENWDPFQEPKDPRELLFSSISRKAHVLIRDFYQAHPRHEQSSVLQKELFDLTRGLLQGESRAQVIFEFCNWYKERVRQ